MNLHTSNFISHKKTIRDSLVQLNELADRSILTLFVLNEQAQLIGTLTDGDIRRGLIDGKSINDEVQTIMYKNFRFLQKYEYSLADVNKFKEDKIHLVPLLDKDKKVIRIIDFTQQHSLIPAHAVLMAGGRGERLKPFTNNTPKPLLEVAGKPIIEYNVDRLAKFGADHFHITLGYLGDQIIDYFKDGSSRGLSIQYTTEQKPLGTIGPLNLISEFSHDNILVMNSDILTNMDYEEFFRQFEQQDAMMTIASIPYNVNVPYAVLETKNDQVLSLHEKPTYTYYSNAGIYLLKKEAIKYIPKDQVYNATDLIELLISKGQKVTNFPMLDYWLDIGKHEDFKKAQEDIKHLRF